MKLLYNDDNKNLNDERGTLPAAECDNQKSSFCEDAH